MSDFYFIKNKSVHIAEKLNHSYGYLSNRFSENACISIENFIILQKAEYAKELIIARQHTFTEIAHRLNYSSAAHLNAPFKKTTGLTPSSFRRLYPGESSKTSGPATGKSMINKEYLNVAVADPGEDIYILFKNAFQEMKMEIRIQSFHSGNDLMNDLEINTQPFRMSCF